MTKHTLLLGISMLTISPALRVQALDNAEVRMPYSELKQLLTRAEPRHKTATPKTRAARPPTSGSPLNGRPVLDATFRATSFANEAVFIPLVSR